MPNTCDSLGKVCGAWDQGCGGVVDCGVCGLPYACNAGLRETTCFPFLLGTVIAPDPVRAVDVVVDIAYVADHGKGLRALDVSDPAHIQLHSFLNLDGVTRSVHVVGNRMYVANYAGGLNIFDVSSCQSACTPQHCEDLGVECWSWGDGCGGTTGDCGGCDDDVECTAGQCVSLCLPAALSGYDTPGSAMGAQVLGSTAYVADFSASLQVLDVSYPATISLLGSYASVFPVYAVQVAGAYTFLANWVTGLQVLDTSTWQSNP